MRTNNNRKLHNSDIDPEWYEKNVSELVTDTIITDSVLPISTGSDTPLVFNVRSIPGKYIDVGGIRLHLRWNVKKKVSGSWVPLATADKVTICNDAHHIMFDEMLVYVNGDLVESTGLCYGLTSYFKNLLTVDDFEKSTWLQSCLWYPDYPNGVNDLVVADETINSG